MTMWSQDSHHLVSELGSINHVISFCIFVSCCFHNKFLSVQCLILLEFATYKKKIIISFYYCSKYISSIKKSKEKKSFKKMFIGFYRRKLNKGKLDQMNSELAQSWYYDYWVPNHTILILGSIGYPLLWFSISGLIKSDLYRFCVSIPNLIVNCSNFIFCLFGLQSHNNWNFSSIAHHLL
jgi:hypothetical protein